MNEMNTPKLKKKKPLWDSKENDDKDLKLLRK